MGCLLNHSHERFLVHTHQFGEELFHHVKTLLQICSLLNFMGGLTLK